MRSNRDDEKAKKQIRLVRTGAIVYIIAAVVFSVTMWYVSILPIKYEVAMTTVVAIITASLAIPVVKRDSSQVSIFLVVIALLIAILMGMGTYFFAEIGNFVNKIVSVEETADFYILVRADSPYEKIEDLKGETVTVPLHNEMTYETAINELKSRVEVETEVTGDSLEVCQDLLKEKCEVAMMNSAYYDVAVDEIDGFDEDAIRVLDTISLVSEPVVETKKASEKGEAFNIYITGIDTSGRISNVARSDVNMIMTVNPNTKKILLTSIPRDYYVMLANVGQMDKLTHSGLMGPDVTVQTVENLLGIDINYYVKVNFSTVTELVDILGGIDVESEYAFTSRKGHYDFVEGINHMDGDMALCFARERYAFSSGDRQRGKNQQAVIKAIINKATSSPSILLKYNDILNALSDKMQTNMDASKIKELVKMQLDDMSGWDISSISLDGSGTYATTYYYPSTELYVMVPNQDTVNNAKASIEAIMKTDGE